MYNTLVERCFNECVTSFRTKARSQTQAPRVSRVSDEGGTQIVALKADGGKVESCTWVKTNGIGVGAPPILVYFGIGMFSGGTGF